MMARSFLLRVALFSSFSFGCAYQTEVESEHTRLVPFATPCPSAESVASQRYVDSAELAGARRIERKPLCWYRIEDEGTSPFCSAPHFTGGSLEEERVRLRELAPNTYETADVPLRGRVECTDEGSFFVVAAAEERCRATLDGLRVSDLEPLFRRGDFLALKELIASDERAPLTLCQYELTHEHTERPFSCSGGKSGALGN